MNKSDLEAIRHNQKLIEELKATLAKFKPHNVEKLIDIEHGIGNRLDYWMESWCEVIKEQRKE